MIKKEIVYENLLQLLSQLIVEYEGKEVEIGLLDESVQALLISDLEQVDKSIKEIELSRDAGIIHKNFGSLVESLERMNSGLPVEKYSKVSVLIEIIQLLREALDGADPELSVDCDTSVYAMVELDRAIHADHFYYCDNNDPSRFLFLLNPSEPEKLKEYLSGSSFPPEGYYQLIEKIGSLPTPFPTNKFVLTNNSYASNKAKVYATLALCLVKEGDFVHSPAVYSSPPNVPSHLTVSIGLDYQQFDDTIQILSEYNEQTDILDKFLRLYHVFENFMHKFPLVEMERRLGGRVFSIRDFRRMFDVSGERELPSLIGLFEKLSNETYSPAIAGSPLVPVKKYIFDQFQDLIPGKLSNAIKLDMLFELLRLRKSKNNATALTFAFIAEANACKQFASIVYAFRNSIVHNRETEFHLTHETLVNHFQTADTALVLLRELLIPTMESLAFFLVLPTNNLVWFNSDFLTLWKK